MRKYGFIALWKHNDAWYTQDPEKKSKFIDRVNEINREAREKGIQMSSVYDCSWSSEWRYFSFWECESLDLIVETIEKLEECGDVNFYNLQQHYIGKEVRDLDHIDIFNPTMFD